MKSASRIRAAVLLVSALGVAGAPAQANAVTGVLSGHVVTDNGAPAANVAVTAHRQNGTSQFGHTGADGSYRFDSLESGQYFIEVSPRDGVKQYVPGKRFNAQAGVYEVKAGEQTVVNETLLPRGNIAGRLVDFDGSPLSGAYVSLRDLDGESYGFTQAGANGNWGIDGVYAGRYEVRFSSSDIIVQAAYGKTGKAKPDPITVAANATTTVNDTAIARTSLRVTATDSLTGAPVTSLTIHIGPRFPSTETGELVVDAIQPGVYDATVLGTGYLPLETEVTLAAGGQQHLAVVLTPESAITAKVVDAATGAPVAGFCVGAFNPSRAWFGDATCGDLTDEAGNVKIGWLTAGTYQLLATPGWSAPPGYGAQWVGANGGTGRQLSAKSFTVAVGQNLTVPVIRLDRAGTITGRVSNPDGSPASSGRVDVLTGHPLSGSSLGVLLNEDGTYTIDFLGPYDWPLLFDVHTKAAQWSGHVGDRFFARTVKVKSGASTAFDFRARAAVEVIVKSPSQVGWVLFYNAVTGDIMGAGSGYLTDDVTEQLVGPQLVKLQIWPEEGDPYFVGGPDLAHAKPYWIPPSGSKTIVIPG
jgi:hypothetical protein